MECVDCSKGLNPSEIEATEYIEDVPLCFQCLNQYPQLIADIPERVIAKSFEALFRELAKQHGLYVYRPAFLHNVPFYLELELPEFIGVPGLPDFFISGDPEEVIDFLESMGLKDIDELKSEYGVFIEVKYSLSESSRPAFQDSQKSVFPKLQDAGFDVFVFRGYQDDYWIKRYVGKPDWVFCQKCGDKISEEHADPRFCRDCSDDIDNANQQSVENESASDDFDWLYCRGCGVKIDGEGENSVFCSTCLDGGKETSMNVVDERENISQLRWVFCQECGDRIDEESSNSQLCSDCSGKDDEIATLSDFIRDNEGIVYL